MRFIKSCIKHVELILKSHHLFLAEKIWRVLAAQLALAIYADA